MNSPLLRMTCCECQVQILVSPYHPHPLESHATGMPATRWDADREEDYFVGWICDECACDRVGVGKAGSISGPNLEFHYGWEGGKDGTEEAQSGKDDPVPPPGQ